MTQLLINGQDIFPAAKAEDVTVNLQDKNDNLTNILTDILFRLTYLEGIINEGQY